jgi:hypothetical protein
MGRPFALSNFSKITYRGPGHIGYTSAALAINATAPVTWFNTERTHESIDEVAPVRAQHPHYRYRTRLAEPADTKRMTCRPRLDSTAVIE